VRQALINEYQAMTGASLIVLIDAIFAEAMTYLEELLVDVRKTDPLHILLSSPGGNGDAAIRMVRSMQMRCTELTVIVPDMAKSAANVALSGCRPNHHGSQWRSRPGRSPIRAQ
jgi:ATP-dependent protease ClpP protease subunit